MACPALLCEVLKNQPGWFCRGVSPFQHVFFPLAVFSAAVLLLFLLSSLRFLEFIWSPVGLHGLDSEILIFERFGGLLGT